MNETPKDFGQSQIVESAGIVSIAVIGSRVVGIIREVVLTYYFEARFALDAFYAAFRIPNLLRDLFAEGDLSKAFIAVFADVETKSGEDAAWRLANLVFTALTIILLFVVFLGIVFSPFIVNLFFMGKGFDTALPAASSFGFVSKRELTIYLTRLMFPFLILVSLAAISMGLLNSKNKFAIPASASAFFNIGSIIVSIAGYYVAPRFGIHPVAGAGAGVLVGGALQFLIQVPSMHRIGFRFRPIFDFRDPHLREIMVLVGPAIISSASMLISVFISSYFASQFEGWLSWITVSFRIMYFVVGVVGVSFSTATLPVLSRLVAENSMDNYKSAFSGSLKMIFALAIPAAAGLIVLSKPIIALIYQHGKFTEYDTVQAAGALACYSFGLFGYASFRIARDGFYALKDIRTPVIISVFTVALNALLNYIFIFRLGFDHRSLPIATSCTITLNFLLVLFFPRTAGWRIRGSRSGKSFIKSVIASAIMGVLVYYIFSFCHSHAGNALSVMIAIGSSFPSSMCFLLS